MHSGAARQRQRFDVANKYARSNGGCAGVALAARPTVPQATAHDDCAGVFESAAGLSAPTTRKQLNAAVAGERGHLDDAFRWPRVLSIDFDGVLHPTGTGATSNATTFFGWLPMLEELLKPHDDVYVLVHSSWRYEYRPNELQMMLGTLEARFVGAAPNGNRYESVLWWLQQNPAFKSYRILDDDASEFPTPAPAELILCDPSRGVSEPRVLAELQAWLLTPP